MKYSLLAVLVASSAFAIEITTGKTSKIAAGSENASTVFNSTLAPWQILNNGVWTGATSCATKPIASAPLLRMNYFSSGQLLTLNNLGPNWTYPQNVPAMNRLKVRFCYHLSGNVPQALRIVPILKDVITNDVYSPGAGIDIAAVFYVAPGSTTSAVLSPVITWDLSLFPMSSNDLAAHRYEFGVRVEQQEFYGFPLDALAVKIHGMELKADFFTTTPPGQPIAPSRVYTPATPPNTWSSANLKVTVSMPDASSAYKINSYIKCGDGVFRMLTEHFWGAGQTQIRNYSIASINSSKCPTAPLVQWGSSQVQTRLVNIDGMETGQTALSSSFILQ